MLTEIKNRFCVGYGLEVGAGKAPRCKPATTVFLDRFIGNRDATERPTIIADAAYVPVRDETFDFVFSSHMLEHHQNTLRVLYEWKRVLKPGGILFLLLPHAAQTIDRHRAVTTFQHHLDDYARLGDEPDTSHYAEIMAGWSKLEDWEKLKAEYEEQWQMDIWDWEGRVRNGVIHYHVWTQNEMVDLVRHAGMTIEYVADIVPEFTISFMVVARR